MQYRVDFVSIHHRMTDLPSRIGPIKVSKYLYLIYFR